MRKLAILTAADGGGGADTRKLSKTLLGGSLGLLLAVALLTSMGQAQADVIADARSDFVAGTNAGDLGIIPATGTGEWRYLASDTVNPTLDPILVVLPWVIIPNPLLGQYTILTTGGSSDAVDLQNFSLAPDELRMHPSAAGRPPSFVVVRWIAGPGEAGLINIVGNVRKVPGQVGGGGVTLEIFVDGVSVFSQTVGGFDTVGFAFDETATVGVGSTVDYVVGPNGGDSFDSTALKTTISLDPTVQLSPDLVIGENPIIGSGTTIESGVSIGDNAQLGSNVQLKTGSSAGDNLVAGDETIIEVNASLGDDVVLGLKVKIEENVLIGDRVTIGDNSVVKKDAVIGNDTSIGAFVTIGDRAVIGAGVVIGDGAIVPADAMVSP